MLRNSESKWGSVAKVFHWVIAVLVLFSLAYGWWMTHLAERSVRVDHYIMHSAIGYDLLLLLVLRLGWRTFDRAPAPPADAAPWERMAAQASHVLLYVLTLAVCVFGWLLTGTMRRPLQADLFNLISVPASSVGRDYHEFMEDAHKIIAYVLLALIAVHVAAALRHHFSKKNDVLRRML